MSPSDIPVEEFANEPSEVHAIMHGIYRGFIRTDPRKIPTDIKDVKGETHYYKFGYLIGWFLTLLAIYILFRIGGVELLSAFLGL